jgi:secreted Zn-dependent insulinase-like peptidase
VTLHATANWAGLKDQRIRSLRNGLLDVNKHSHWLRLRLLMSGNHPWEDTIAGLEATEAAAIAEHRQRIIECCHIEALVEGNIGADRAIDMCR